MTEGQAFSQITPNLLWPVLSKQVGSTKPRPSCRSTASSLLSVSWKRNLQATCENDQPQLTSDDVVKIRTAACRWNVGEIQGLVGDTFFCLQEMEQFEKSWHYDPQGEREYTVEAAEAYHGLRKFGLHPPSEYAILDSRELSTLGSMLIELQGCCAIDAWGLQGHDTWDSPD